MSKIRWSGVLLICFGLNASADMDFLIFPELGGSLSKRISPDNGKTHIEFIPAGDFFLSAHFGHFNFLGEYFLSKDEADLERLQVGWDFNEEFKIRLGRGHNFLGYWNTEFHHGSFLETSINRPAVVEFEDEDGLVPTHITGISLTIGHAVENGYLNYSLAFGLAPNLKEGQLDAFDIIDPRPSDHDLGGSLRIAFRPDPLSRNEIGVFAGLAKIDGEWMDFSNVTQQQVGAFVNWELDDARIISSVFYIPNRIEQASSVSHDTFVSGYVQAEYALNEAWRVYARFEKTGNVDEVREVFPDLVKQWVLGGVRFDIGSKNALKLELGHKRQLDEANFEVQIEWSAVLP